MCRQLALAVAFLFPSLVVAQSVEEGDFHSSAENAPAATEKADLNRTAELILRETNQFRRREGRSELRVNPQLSRAAQKFAAYLARTDKFSHTADGRQPSDRVSAEGYRYCLVLENIAYRFNSTGFTSAALAQGFVSDWEHSPGHRKNLLDADVDEIGIGVAHSPETGRYYAVQDFGRPHSEAFHFDLVNGTGETIHYRANGKEYSLPPHYTMSHEMCRPPRVQVPRDAEGKPEDGKSVTPASGARLVIHEHDGQLDVEQQTRTNPGIK